MTMFEIVAANLLMLFVLILMLIIIGYCVRYSVLSCLVWWYWDNLSWRLLWFFTRPLHWFLSYNIRQSIKAINGLYEPFRAFGMAGPSFNPPLMDHVQKERGLFNLERPFPPPDPLSFDEIYDVMSSFDKWQSPDKILVIPERLTKGEHGAELRELIKERPYVKICPFSTQAYIAPRIAFNYHTLYLMQPRDGVMITRLYFGGA